MNPPLHDTGTGNPAGLLAGDQPCLSWTMAQRRGVTGSQAKLSSAFRSSMAWVMRRMNSREVSGGCILGASGGWPSVPVHQASAEKSCWR